MLARPTKVSEGPGAGNATPHTISGDLRHPPMSNQLDRGTLWRLPAALSSIALLALLAWPILHDFPSGTATRQALASVLAVGACCMLLGLGLGLWIMIRVRKAAALAAAAGAVFVALVWWWVVFAPLLRPSTGG